MKLIQSFLRWRQIYRAWGGKEREGMDKGGEEKTKKGSNGLIGEEESEFGFWERERERERERATIILTEKVN